MLESTYQSSRILKRCERRIIYLSANEIKWKIRVNIKNQYPFIRNLEQKLNELIITSEKVYQDNQKVTNNIALMKKNLFRDESRIILSRIESIQHIHINNERNRRQSHKSTFVNHERLR
jgi:shikimate kinase